MKKSNCTFMLTGKNYVEQFWAPCYTCFGDGNETSGVCLSCLVTCHKDHHVGSTRNSRFFCDCVSFSLCKQTQLTQSTQSTQSTQPTQPTQAMQCTNDLAKKLFDSMTKANQLVYSPFSIEYILSLLHLGAVDNTYDQLTNLLGRETKMEHLLAMVKTFNDESVKMANALIVNKNNLSVDPSYVEIVKNLALIMNRDFSDVKMVADEANAFIMENTNNLITDMINPSMLNDHVMMLLVNTIYFKSVWAKPFKKLNTQQEIFSNASIMVDMMMQTSTVKYFENSQVQLCNLPYADNKYCMVVVLPKYSTVLTDFMKYLTNPPETKDTYVELHIPKFRQQKRVDLIPIMKENGLTDIFCEYSKLDKMITPGSLSWASVSSFCHEAVVIVDEVGTEAAAAAATSCAVLTTCMSAEPEPVIFYANHPFMYAIRHLPTNSLMFVGSFYGLND